MKVYFHGLKTGAIPTADELRELFKREVSLGKIEGAGIRKEQLDKAYQDLKKRVEEREAKKAERAAEKASGSREHTPLGIRVKEKPVRRPIEKTFGEEGLVLKETKPEEPALAESKKTIGPATPAQGVEIKATPIEKTISPAALSPAPEAPAAPPPTPNVAVPVAAAPVEEKPKLVDELERLAKLKELGALTPEEFEAAKKKLLG